MNFLQISSAVVIAMFLSTAGSAQSPSPTAKTGAAAPTLVVGATVFDPQGEHVGTIESITNDQIVIDTGTHKATLPKSSFRSGTNGPTINATKAQVDALVAASMEKAAVALRAALVPGAEVRGKSGALIGTIKKVTGDQVLLDRPTGSVMLTTKAFATGPQGLFISMTAAELEAAAKAAMASP